MNVRQIPRGPYRFLGQAFLNLWSVVGYRQGKPARGAALEAIQTILDVAHHCPELQALVDEYHYLLQEAVLAYEAIEIPTDNGEQQQ